MNDSVLERHYRVFGRVQMVMFRDFAKRKADKLGIFGFVKNEKNGSVFIIAQGEKQTLDSYDEYLKRGSLFSKVEKLEKTDVSIMQKFHNFEIQYE